MVREMSREGGEGLGRSLRLGDGVQDSKLHWQRAMGDLEGSPALDRPTKLKERRDQVSLATLTVTPGFGSTLNHSSTQSLVGIISSTRSY